MIKNPAAEIHEVRPIGMLRCKQSLKYKIRFLRFQILFYLCLAVFAQVKHAMAHFCDHLKVSKVAQYVDAVNTKIRFVSVSTVV